MRACQNAAPGPKLISRSPITTPNGACLLHDDQKLFEFLILEGAQAGLSWETILSKRDNYRAAFDQFDAAKVARYGQQKIQQLLLNPGIIRNRLKVAAAIQNAKAFGAVQRRIWQFRRLPVAVCRRSTD